ncbi:MAG: DEAD/DEAH box helicase [Amnibacterium sp.]
MAFNARNNRTPSGAKRRWTADDRARRDAAPSRGRAARPVDGAPLSRAARRDATFGADRRRTEGDGTRQDRRPDWYPGPRTNPRRNERTDRERRDDRDGRSRFGREDRPRTERSREDRAPRFRDERPREERGPRREERAPRLANERPRDGAAPRFREDRSERSPRADRPARSFRADAPAPRHDRVPQQDRRRDDRPQRQDRRPVDGRPDRRRQDDQVTAWTPPEDVVLERLEGEVVTAADVAGATFADLGLGDGITKALAELGAVAPFPIQAATIPDALAGRNVLGRGRTGSGKTIAFGAALVERLLRNWQASGRGGTGRRMGRAPRALILAPTRELALQIDRTVQPIARAVGLFTTQIVGGVPQGRQVGALAKGVDIVIGTPGRIEDLIDQGRLDLGEIEITVLDEADHMADLGFLEPMQRLLRLVPESGQRMLFSATLDAAVAQLVDEFLPEPAVHEVADVDGGSTAVHKVLLIEQGEKLPVLQALLSSVERSLVFARTRAFAEQLADDLDGVGVKAESLHGDLNQARRSRNLARFADGKVDALVATDVAARGIHVDDIELVVHADAAEDYKTYLHRSGRTGRAGASGTVVTLINARRRRRFAELLERAGIEAEFLPVKAGEDPVAVLAR